MIITWYFDRKSYLRYLRCAGDLWVGDAMGLVLNGDWVSRVAMPRWATETDA